MKVHRMFREMKNEQNVKSSPERRKCHIRNTIDFKVFQGSEFSDPPRVCLPPFPNQIDLPQPIHQLHACRCTNDGTMFGSILIFRGIVRRAF